MHGAGPASVGTAVATASAAYSVGYIIASPVNGKEKRAETDLAEPVGIQHPSRELLKKNGFIQYNYDKWHSQCIQGTLPLFPLSLVLNTTFMQRERSSV